MYLLDTDTFTNPLKPRPSEALRLRLLSVGRPALHVSAVTVGEVAYGAGRSDREEYHLSRMRTLLLTRVTLLPFDEEVALVYGRIRAELSRRGTPLEHPDLQIAATALRHGLVMVTGNLKHFSRVPGLTVENWL